MYKEFSKLFSFQDNSFYLLIIVSTFLFIAALLDFEALKRGKLAIVEPIFAFEVPVSAFLAFFLLNEIIGKFEILLIVILVLGLILLSLRSVHLNKKLWLEKGVLLEASTSIFMGFSNFSVGFASRVTTPLLTNWFLNVYSFLICLFYFICKKRLGNLIRDIKENKGFLLLLSVFDNSAWIFYAIAASLAPIAIVVALSESYIIVSVLLGLILNKERLMRHQKLGLIVSILSAIVLIGISM